MSGGHSHGTVREGQERMLLGALALTASFMIVEVIGAFWTSSLALLSDAAHMLTDVVALGISLWLFGSARRQPTRSELSATPAPRSWQPHSMLPCCSSWPSTSSTRRISAFGHLSPFNRV